MTTTRLSLDQNFATTNVYEAPSLSISEIADCLQEVDLEIPQHELRNPTSNRICSLYKCLLQLISYKDDTHQENDQQQNDNGDGTDMNPVADYLTLQTIFKDMKHSLMELGYSDFKFTDLTHPTSSRTTKIFSFIINYLKLCDPSWQEFEALAGQEESILLKTQKHEDENHEIRQRNTETRHELDNMEPLHVWESRTDEMKQTLQALERTAQLKEDEFAQIKNKRHSLTDNMDNIQGYTTKMEAELKALQRRSEIDYSSLLSKIKSTEKTLRRLEKGKETERQHLATMTHTNTQQLKCIDLISKAYKMKTQMIQDLENMRQLNTIMNNLKDNIYDFDTKLNKLASDRMDIEAKIKEIETARHKLYAHRDKKRETISIHMTKLGNDRQKTMQEVAERKQQTQIYLESNRKMKQKAQELKKDYIDYIEKRSSQVHRLENKLSLLNGRLDGLISEKSY